MGIVDGKTICQVALVVKNIEETAKAYAELFGVGCSGCIYGSA